MVLIVLIRLSLLNIGDSIHFNYCDENEKNDNNFKYVEFRKV